jgi:hypothetical protein
LKLQQIIAIKCKYLMDGLNSRLDSAKVIICSVDSSCEGICQNVSMKLQNQLKKSKTVKILNARIFLIVFPKRENIEAFR